MHRHVFWQWLSPAANNSSSSFNVQGPGDKMAGGLLYPVFVLVSTLFEECDKIGVTAVGTWQLFEGAASSTPARSDLDSTLCGGTQLRHNSSCPMSRIYLSSPTARLLVHSACLDSTSHLTCMCRYSTLFHLLYSRGQFPSIQLGFVLK